LIELLELGPNRDRLAQSLPTGTGRLVELGRALAAEPRFLLLDEPASGQSADETATFKRLMRRIAADGVGILLVEHDVPLVMDVCSVIHVLDFGRLIASGPPAAIRNDGAVQAAYLGVERGAA
jgi:branched-chain amino acid transport system ATP-binding protein